MRPSLTRRSFVKSTSAGLATVGVLSTGVRSLYAGVSGKANTLALHGGTPVRAKPFSETWPIIDEREEKALVKALKSRNWCCLRGNAVYDFEKLFAAEMGVPHCVLTNGGTTALRTSLAVLDVGPGDEVITTPHTFIATINTITNLHALPVFVDVDADTGSIDADLIEDAITEHTRAILPVHLNGLPADIEKIMAISKRHKIPVVEDACQSVFSEVGGKKIGTFGTTGCISFQEWKSLVCGEGGAILGHDEELMRRCAAFINNGRDPKREERGYPFPGSNHRMTEFQAAVLTEQFKRFQKQDPLRQKNGRYIEKELAKLSGLTPRQALYEGYTHHVRPLRDGLRPRTVPGRPGQPVRQGSSGRGYSAGGRGPTLWQRLSQREDAGGPPEFPGIPGGLLQSPAGEVPPIAALLHHGRRPVAAPGNALDGQQDPLPGQTQGYGPDRRGGQQGRPQPRPAYMRR
ncbi:MAG: aminotransferase class V-fold PLP-dependent enzyme [Phycisphaerales bacterium]|nr:MAG: aminotransferase class V-fold PLP-dependent enzyme [Phycisphaerales bacterium]